MSSKCVIGNYVRILLVEYSSTKGICTVGMGALSTTRPQMSLRCGAQLRVAMSRSMTPKSIQPAMEKTWNSSRALPPRSTTSACRGIGIVAKGTAPGMYQVPELQKHLPLLPSYPAASHHAICCVSKPACNVSGAAYDVMMTFSSANKLSGHLMQRAWETAMRSINAVALMTRSSAVELHGHFMQRT